MHRIRLPAALVLTVIALSLAGWLQVLRAPAAEAINEYDINSSLDGQNLVVTATNPNNNPLSWQYATGVSAADCRDGGLVNELRFAPSNLINGNQLTLTIEDTIYCFKITDEIDDTSAWHVYQLPPPQPIDDQGPGIIIRRSRNNLLSISSRDADLNINSWYYGQFDHNPNCETINLNNNLPANLANNLALREVDNGSWYCFKALDETGNATFAKYKVTGVDTTIPGVNINQAGRVLTATADNNEVVSWHYVSSPAEVDCDEDTFLNNRSVIVGSQITLTSDRVGYYYCFRATDQAGNFSFKKYQVGSVDFLAPRVSLKKINLSINASSDQDIRQWSYLKSADALNCEPGIDFSSGTNFNADQPVELSEDDHLYYFCFRGVNATNTAGYARIRVDARIPQITLTVDETTISATADQDGLRWAYLKTDDELDCDLGDAERFEDDSNFDKHQGPTSQLNELDNEKWFCFQATDRDGRNYSYAKQQISDNTTRPPGGAGSSTRGQTDIIIITALLVVGGGGFIAYLIIKHKKSAPDSSTPPPPVDEVVKKPPVKRRRKRSQPAAIPKEDTTQPLDYLKKNREEKED